MNEDLSKGERTRLTVVEAAYELFVTTGYHATSMRQIAERAGLVVGGVYNHFAGKEEIFEAVVFTYHPFQALIPKLNRESERPIEELLRAAAQELLAAIGERPGLVNLLFIELVEFKGKHIPKLAEVLYPAIATFQQKMATAPGRLRITHPAVVFRIFLGSVFAHYLTSVMLSRTPLNEATRAAGGLGDFDEIIDMLFYGIIAPDAAPTPPFVASAPPPPPAPATDVRNQEPPPSSPTWKGGRRSARS